VVNIEYRYALKHAEALEIAAVDNRGITTHTEKRQCMRKSGRAFDCKKDSDAALSEFLFFNLCGGR
jgi:hypothetical protein